MLQYTVVLHVACTGLAPTGMSGEQKVLGQVSAGLCGLANTDMDTRIFCVPSGFPSQLHINVHYNNGIKNNVIRLYGSRVPPYTEADLHMEI